MPATCDKAKYTIADEGLVDQAGVFTGVVEAKNVPPDSTLKLRADFHCVSCDVPLAHRKAHPVEGLAITARAAHFKIKEQKHADECPYGQKLMVDQHKCMQQTADGYKINVNIPLPGYTKDPSLKGRCNVRYSSLPADTALRVYGAYRDVLDGYGEDGLERLVVSYKDTANPYPWKEFCFNRSSYGDILALINMAGDRYRARPFLIVANTLGVDKGQRIDGSDGMVLPMQTSRIKHLDKMFNLAVKVRCYNPDLFPLLSGDQSVAFVATSSTSPKTINWQLDNILRDYDYFADEQELEIVFDVRHRDQIISADEFKPS